MIHRPDARKHDRTAEASKWGLLALEKGTTSMADNKVRYGLRNLHIAFRDPESSDASPAWDAPIAIPGVVGFKPTAVGDVSTFYADDGPYFVVTANNGYTADLETALIPDEVIADMLNWTLDDNGALIEDSDAIPAPFAMMFEVQGDQKNRRTVYYECTAARPAREEKTREAAITPGTDVVALTIIPMSIGDRMTPKASLELSDSNTAAYEAFFDDVYVEVSGS